MRLPPLALLALSVASCRTPSPSTATTAQSAVAPTPSTVAPSPSVAPPAPSPPRVAPCDALMAEHRESVARLPPGEEGGPPVLPAHLGECVAVPGGAWAVVLHDDVPPEGERSFHWLVRWRGDDGTSAELLPPIESPHCPEPASTCNLPARGGVAFDALRTFDVDGDGRMEFFVGAEHRAEEGVYGATRAIYALRDGQVQEVDVGLAFGRIQGVDDVDHDGRVDVLSHGPYTGDEDACSPFPVRVIGPLLVGHSLGGGRFNWEDDVARAFARRSCPRQPTALATPQDIACARLWGWSPERTRRALRCRALRPSDDCRRLAAGVCGDFAVRDDWAQAPAPVSLEAPTP